MREEIKLNNYSELIARLCCCIKLKFINISSKYYRNKTYI